MFAHGNTQWHRLYNSSQTVTKTVPLSLIVTMKTVITSTMMMMMATTTTTTIIIIIIIMISPFYQAPSLLL